MTISKRLQLLEQKQSIKNDYFQIAVFIVTPGINSRGYVCEGVTILREPDETIEDLQKRAKQSVAWSTETSQKIFTDLE